MGARSYRALVGLLTAEVLVVVALWGCGGARVSDKPEDVATDRPDPQETTAAYIVDLAPYLTRVEGRCQTDQTRSRFVAYFEGGEVRYVIEQTDAGEYGTEVAVNEYFFDDGRLFHYHENRRAVAYDAGFPSTTAVAVRLSFDGSGALSRASKAVDGAPAAVTDEEVMSVRRHVEHLRLAAREIYLRGRRRAGR